MAVGVVLNGAIVAGDRRETPLIEACQLTVGYGGAPIVREIDLKVHAHEVVALLGPNGAGKSTTLLALAGELKPMGGSVRWDGNVVSTPLHRRARAGLAFLPESKSVFSGLTAAQNLAISQVSAAADATRMFPELREVLTRRGGALSGGEQRMLAVGRSLSGETRLLVADELSMGLAPKTVGRILGAIREAADAGLGALIVEQHVHRALEVADRVYVMQGGRIRLSMDSADAAGAVDEIRASYLATNAGSKDQPD
jgi:ABC-type branched-subunit amino acid transport system ATPase component